MQPIDSSTKKILDKYGSKIESKSGMNMLDQPTEKQVFSREYNVFRDESLRLSNSFYERACNFAENTIKIAPKPGEATLLQEAIEKTHINISPTGAYSLATLVMFISIILGVLFGLVNYLLMGEVKLFIPLFFIIGGLVALNPLSKYPMHLEAKWRLEASNQMVMCILYVVMYLRHTSNLEHALKFAGEHIGNPLALDFRKIVWDVETQRYSTIKEALDLYLDTWTDHNLAFVESFHLIESSIIEGDSKRRLDILEKALEVMLEGTYESMLHFAQNVKSPITTLHMLGVILPILGLIILPLLGSFLGVKWYQLSLVYNLVLPLIVYFMGYRIMSKRPVGYSQGGLFEDSPRFANMRKIQIGKEPNVSYIEPKTVAIGVIFVFLLIGFLPILVHLFDPSFDLDLPDAIAGKFLDYRDIETDTGIKTSGPFGLGATLFSLLIPFGIAFGLSIYYKARSKNLIVIRDKTKRLEKEFQGALFQVGNRLGGGFPPEMIFGDVAKNLRGTPTGEFFKIVDRNIRSLGMDITQAVFDSKVGAINSFPSSLIESSMKVLIETSKKGPLVASKALMSISIYLDRINKVNERLKDLLAEIVGSMRAQISFLSPVISGIVVGIGSMITAIIGGLGTALESTQGGDEFSGGASSLTEIFSVEELIPPFFFQIVVSIYLIQIVYILSIMSNGIEAGVDKLNEEHILGKNLYKSVLFYLIVTSITVVAFNFLAVMISQGASSGF
jgi:Flp pilus assembly protein TadB